MKKGEGTITRALKPARPMLPGNIRGARGDLPAERRIGQAGWFGIAAGKILFMSVMLATAILQCAPFPTRYERIEDDALRPIGFVYDPYAEAAPGDTMRVHAYFAGQKVVSVQWSISYDRLINNYGQDTILNVIPLRPLAVQDHLPDSTAISFVIPDSIFFKTRAVSAQALNLIRPGLPQAMRTMSQQELAAVLAAAAGVDFSNPVSIAAFFQTWGPVLGITDSSAASTDSLFMATAALVTVFSIPAVLFATVTSEEGRTLKVRGDFSIRYNRRFQAVPAASLLPVNRNPAVRWIGVYKVHRTGLQTFDPLDQAYAGDWTLAYLHNDLHPDSVRDTVFIEPGYTYFVGADSGIVGRDTLLDRLHYVSPRTHRDTTEFETWHWNWQYQNLDLDSVTQPLDSLFMLAGQVESNIVGMLPSLDTKLTRGRIWVTVYDTYLGEFNRPRGFAIKNVDIFFKYSDAYQLQHQ